MMRPSTSGRATFIAMSRAARPWVPSRQAASLEVANTTCSTGQSAAANGVCAASPPGAATAKPVAFRITSGGASASTSSRIAAATGSFRLATNTGSAFSPRRARPVDQGIDRGEVSRLHQRPVEDDGRDRPALLPALAQRREVAGLAAAGVDAGAQQRPRLAPLPLPADQGRGIAQELCGVVDAAMDQVLPQPVPGLGRHGGEFGELRVRLVVAGEEGQRRCRARGRSRRSARRRRASSRGRPAGGR